MAWYFYNDMNKWYIFQEWLCDLTNNSQLSFYYSEGITKFKIFCNKCMPRSQHAKGKVRMIGSRHAFESQSLNIGESIPGAIWLATVLAIYSVIDIE